MNLNEIKATIGKAGLSTKPVFHSEKDRQRTAIEAHTEAFFANGGMIDSSAVLERSSKEISD